MVAWLNVQKKYAAIVKLAFLLFLILPFVDGHAMLANCRVWWMNFYCGFVESHLLLAARESCWRVN